MKKRMVPQQVYTEKYFEADCGGYEEWIESSGQKLPVRLQAAFDLVPLRRGMKIIDWGCGRGELCYHAAVRGADVLGLDYSKAAINLTKKLPKPKRGKMKFELVSNLKIPAPDKSIDRIFFIDVIEHLYPEQVKEVIGEFYRVLKRGGKLILHTAPNRDYYDKGYRYWTRRAHALANPMWRVVFRETLRSDKNPRFGYDKDVHINECSLSDVVMYLQDSGLKSDVWYDSSFRRVRLRDKLRYAVFQPQIGPMKKWFSEDIWAVGTK